MPKYELMYILSSAVSDDEVPNVVSEIDEYLKSQGGTVLSSEMLGKKKLAYPIKKTRNGFYVLQTFNLEGGKLQALDNKIRSINHIVRYIVVNLEDMERQKTKTKALQEQLKLSRKPKKPESEPAPVAEPEIKFSESELEEKIESALESEDLTK
ncbi:MAG: 30S ribosomal protein S6 [bacterium]|nr:30S ribosomal protein S6 [bacterium]